MKRRKRITKKLANRDERVTWDMVYEDFKERYPRLVEDVTLWFAYDIGQIAIHLTGGMELIYDYDTHRAMVQSN